MFEITKSSPESSVRQNRASQPSNDSNAELPLITKRYLLAIDIDCYQDHQGRRYVDQLWHKDLLEHIRYLKQLVLVSPCRHEPPPQWAIALDTDPAFANVEFVDLPAPNNYLQAVLAIPAKLKIFWQAIKEADVVHSAVVGHYIPIGWFVTPIVLWHKKFYLIIVESAFWRLRPGFSRKPQTIVKAWAYERINRWCMNHTDLAIFTQPDYLKSLLTRHPKRGHIIHASWIDGQTIVSETEATNGWREKLSRGRLHIAYVGRLYSGKGVLTLLRAMQILSARGVAIRLDILGEGELLDDCEAVSQQVAPNIEVRLLPFVPYGTELFQQIQTYHAIVVPSLADEQPRIVYDAYSQAVPVLASNTDGLRACVEDGITGKFAEPDNSEALAALIQWASENLPDLQRMGMNSLQRAHGFTHQDMHRKRWKLLLEELEEPVSANVS